MNEELNNLRPGDCFLVDFNGRQNQLINRSYHPYRGLWLTVCKVLDDDGLLDDPDGYVEYYAIYDRKKNDGRRIDSTLSRRLDGLVWIPKDDFHEFRRYDKQNRPPAQRTEELPDL